MKTNVGNADRVIRVIVAIICIALIFAGPFNGNTVRIILGVVAAIMIITSLFRVCPLYRVFGFNTCTKPNQLS